MNVEPTKGALHSLPLSQIALSTSDLRRSDAFWREGLGFLPSATSRMFRGPTISNLMRVEDAKTTTRWLIGQDEWLQIEIWQFENPVPRLQPCDYAPNHIGYSRCGVWVKQFETTVDRLEKMGYPSLTAPSGDVGGRRVCVRDPDGIYVELFECDPLEGVVPTAPYVSNAALRSITLSSPDLGASCRFVEQGLGLTAAPGELHEDHHELLWGLKGAVCQRKTYISAKMLLEVVEYQSPQPVPRHPHSRLIDQGILNIAFGDSKSVRGIRSLEDQAIKQDAAPTERMITPLGGCVYVTDQQGFSYELTWASRFLAQRIAGYFPRKSEKFHTAENQKIEEQVTIAASTEEIWPCIADPQLMSAWSDLGKISALRSGEQHEFGVGAERKLVRGRHEMVEQITRYVPNKEVAYRIVRRGPFSAFCGQIVLEEVGGATTVNWIVHFRARIPFIGGLLKSLLARRYRKSLLQLKQFAEPASP